jgi:hypothetical protein
MFLICNMDQRKKALSSILERHVFKFIFLIYFAQYVEFMKCLIICGLGHESFRSFAALTIGTVRLVVST